VICACIDIGSNTTRLLVADAKDGRLREVLQHRAYTRLRGDGPIPPEKIEGAAAALEAQLRAARECGCAPPRVVGTSALREAPNRDAVLAALAARTGVEVEILSGEEEARLAFAGATATLPEAPEGEVGVVDVGGGSTELVVGTLADGVTWSTSFPVGSGVLADRHLRSDPPAPEEVERVREDVRTALHGMAAPQPRAALAVGGSAGSLRLLVGDVLDREALDRGLEVLRSAPAADVARRVGLDVERVRVLPAGLVLLDEASAALGTPLRIGFGGLREGIVLELASGTEAAA
jgi:exopolyphosphatase/guanosine-5'-triphosphate,3'-diphosphate pyrophosphatase